MEPKLAYNVVRFYFTLYLESKVNSHQFIEQYTIGYSISISNKKLAHDKVIFKYHFTVILNTISLINFILSHYE